MVAGVNAGYDLELRQRYAAASMASTNVQSKKSVSPASVRRPSLTEEASMTRALRSPLFRIILAWASIAVVTAACASSLPPAKPATDVGQIAGTWTGTGYGPGWPVPVTQTFNQDGNYFAVLPNVTFTGKVTVSEGKLRGKSDQTGDTYTYTLHEGEGRRVLIWKSDDGRLSFALMPSKMSSRPIQ
jgi:hypothetical protein